MQVALENNIVFVVIEYLAILCWGLSGGLAAIRKGYDIFTIMLCGCSPHSAAVLCAT